MRFIRMRIHFSIINVKDKLMGKTFMVNINTVIDNRYIELMSPN